MSAQRILPNSKLAFIHRNILVLMGALILCALTLIPAVSWGQVSGGLQRSVSVMEQIREWAWLIIPIVCLLSGGIAGVLYSMDIIRKDTLYTWIGGTVFAGLIAGGMVELVF